MKNLILGLAWVASLAVAFYVGQTLVGQTDGDGSPDLLRTSPALAPLEGSPTLVGGGGRPAGERQARRANAATAERGPAGESEIDIPKEALEGDLEALLARMDNPAMAHALLRAKLTALLAKGREGHLEVVELLDKMLQDKSLERLFGGSEAQAARFAYPWIRYLVQREAQVVDLTETVFQTMARDPGRFEGMDDDTLEVFTEGLGIVLPGVIDEERLEGFRKHAHAILEAPEESQPKAVRSNRNEIERMLAAWAPPMTKDQMLEVLRAGEVEPRQLRSILSQLGPDDLAKVDLVPILVPLIKQGDHQAIRALQQVGAAGLGGLGPLDAAMIDGLAAGTAQAWAFQSYLASTRRHGWPAAQGLVEMGLRRGGKAVEQVAQTLMRLNPKPDAAYVQSVIDGYDLSEGLVSNLKANFGLN